uniref:MULE transposase domain-containing protein n=1 Tax=Lactuca sativa TaxID=4236 RepID=A0A9R1ULF1_LACSA|nr:hypothetical protein LSAT_V11C800413560 [Lactuca sativa]
MYWAGPGCRRVIGLDGCFLKGQIKGELLTAVGRDEDNHVYPIAWAVIDVENKDNWTWFIELLVADLDLDCGRVLVGLLQAVTELLPYVEHRQCARHIYVNFRKKYTGLELKNLFWEAAKSSMEGDFIATMKKIKHITSSGYEWMMSNKPHSWCRAFFSHGYACEAIENGISECFNSMIIHMREKPILTMLEEIRIYLMNRFYHQAAIVSQWKGDYGPNTLEKIKEFGKHMRFWIVIPSGGALFETRHGYSAYKISGLPCVHTQAAINFTHKDPADFISFWFHKAKFIETYRDNILPINGSNMWPYTEYLKPLPPLVRRMLGRPKTKRRRHALDCQDSKFPNQKEKVCRTVRCGKCRELGHNKLSCKNGEGPSDPISKRKNG